MMSANDNDDMFDDDPRSTKELQEGNKEIPMMTDESKLPEEISLRLEENAPSQWEIMKDVSCK